MITFHEFYANPGDVDINLVRVVLQEEGLVGPKNDSFGRTERDILIWEDETGNGRYRVHITENDELADGTLADGVRFAYWMMRIDRTLLERDPMAQTRERIYEIFQGKIFRDIKTEGPIEEVLQYGPMSSRSN